MGETSVYYVPKDEARWLKREREAAMAFWALGLFVATSDDWTDEELARYQREARPLPESPFTFSFGDMGFGGSGEWEPVPNLVYDQACPACGGAIGDEMHELWEDESSVPLPKRSLACPHCGKSVAAGAGISPEPFTFSRFYLWVSDIDEADWQPEFQQTVESVLGPCTVYKSWET